MSLEKLERVSMIYTHLAAAPTPESIDDTVQLLHSTVDAVEDEFSGILREKNPSKESSARMYGPKEDSIELIKGGAFIRTFGNYIYVWSGGGFVVLNLYGQVLVANLPKGV